MTRPIRVLHLEDNPRDAELLHERLRAAGMSIDITLVSDRERYAAALAGPAFDLILTDYNVPGYDGIAAVMLARERHPDVPVIVVSGTVGEEEAVQCLHVGATDYLLKMRLERLVSAVERAIQDTKERRRRRDAENELRQRERWLSSIYEAVADSLFYLAVGEDGDYRFVSVNRAFLRTTGLEEKQVVGKPVTALIPEPSLTLVLEKYAEAIGKKQIVGWEETTTYPTGTMTGAVSVAPVFDDQGRCTHLVGAVHDLTARKRMEEVLRESEGRYRLLFEESPAGIVLIDPTTQAPVVFNSRAHRQLGYSRDEFARLRIPDFEVVEQPEETTAHVAAILREGRDEFETVHRTKQGELRNVVVSAQRIASAGAPLLYCVFRDVTELKRTSAELHERTERFNQLLSQMDDVAWIASADGSEILDVNDAFERVYGFPASEFMSNPKLWIERVHLEDRQIAEASTEDLFRTGRATAEYRIVRPDGTVRWILDKKALTYDEAGAPVRMGGVGSDVTERKQLEAQFRQAQKMEAVGRLAAGVAHDFNNLLTVINSYSEFLLEDLDPEDSRRKDVEEIRKAGVSAAGLTRQLLTFSRQQVLQPQVLDPNDVLAKAESLLKRMIGEDIAVVMTLAPQLGAIRADPGQLEQVIMNLAVNARDAMPTGGKLTIETGNAEMDEAYLRNHAVVGSPGRYVMLAMSDTGIGMDETTKAHLFEPFFTTKEPGKGTGLGLATVYGVVKQSGGFIWVYSEPGHGTTFKVYLPRVDEPVRGVAGPAVATESLRGVETVLLVEDMAAVRSAARHTLERQGYTVLEAPDGAAALRLAADHAGPIHLVVTDVIMPGMNGRQFAEQLAAARPNLKVLYTSGYTDDAVVRHGVLEAGVQFLQKPFTPDALARKVRAVLDSPPAS